ncbi:MAG TPA: HEAT repeat domain-containing protein [Puia sp.]|nr:HEAT repeat domain-containing protein [Puia sp.]
MPCQKHKDLLERWWNDRLTESERSELEAQLMQCEDCRRELEGSRELWELMSYMPVPEPSGDMQVQFDAMLENYKAEAAFAEATAAEAGMGMLRELFWARPGMAAAFCGALILGGFLLGMMINRAKPVTVQGPAVAIVQKPVDTMHLIRETDLPTKTIAVAEKKPPTDGKPSTESKQLEALTAQVREMRELMMLSLLQNPAASERIRAVSYTSEIGHVNPHIAAALLATLNNDPNVNVRLTTLEALTHFARDPVVREGLIQSILQQESPLVQAALADVMLKLQEKRAIQPFKKLLQQKDLNGMVRSKIEQTITQLT